ncbi:TonB-dependent receptor plug domain-containing protein [Winogradskyella alexanderae]|uniref:TonB-dependent receptor n=1 Tax=Winogradskyella alexanderae TaxID=2877123 RepID=A0ABS7XY38_9FLAO|nr:TonB-dependent receptor [Winogradskyella alexanderae]MCA0133777.1 TonB-dependent receptor [Winogradskyella alexanderae]
MSKLFYRIVLFLFLVAFCNFSHGQSEKDTPQPLANILQTLESRFDIKFSFEPKTIEGKQALLPKEELTLRQSLRELSNVLKLDFKILSNRFVAIVPLEEKDQFIVQHLEEIVVKNYLTKGISKTNNGVITANTKTFTILPGLIEPDVLQIIQKLPGIVSVDERISNINIRGGTNDQNLILYEGIRMFQSGHFFGLISAFNPYLTDEVNISKNGTSARYGRGVSSLISISNSDDITRDFEGGIGANLLSIDGFAKIPISEKIAVQLSARRSFTDVFASLTYDAYFDRIFRDSELNTTDNTNTQLALDERFVFNDFNLKFLYDIDNTSKLRINFFNIYNGLDYNQVFTTTQNNIQESQSDLYQNSFGASVRHSKLWSNSFKTTVEAYYSNYDLEASNNDLTNNQTLTQENKVEDSGIRIDLSKSVSENLVINSGYQFNEAGVTNFEDVTNPIFTSLIKEVVRTHSLYGEVEWNSLSKNSSVRLGARMSYFDKFSEVVMEPRIAFNQKFYDYFRLEILAELKSQTITQIIDLQQDFFGIEKRRWQLANGKDVPLIKSQQVSAGISYDKNDLLISAEFYYKFVDNITARSQGFQNQFQFINDIGSYTIKGVDFLINKRFEDFSTWISYSYSKNDYTFQNLNNGSPFPNTLDLTHVVNASFTYNVKNFKIGLGINWHSGRPFTEPASAQDNSNSTIEFEAPNSSRISSYFRTDISAIYNFDMGRKINAEVGASVWNIFNQTNIINRFYTLDSDNSILQIDNQALKFTPNLSVRLKF